ncbi:MAG: hypothetical protein ACPL7L_02280 [bacterium]
MAFSRHPLRTTGFTHLPGSSGCIFQALQILGIQCLLGAVVSAAHYSVSPAGDRYGVLFGKLQGVQTPLYALPQTMKTRQYSECAVMGKIEKMPGGTGVPGEAFCDFCATRYLRCRTSLSFGSSATTYEPGVRGYRFLHPFVYP